MGEIAGTVAAQNRHVLKRKKGYIYVHTYPQWGWERIIDTVYSEKHVSVALQIWASALLTSSPQQTRWWTWPGRWTRCSWPQTPGSPWWPPPLRWWRRDIGEIWREKKKLESHLQVPSLLFSGTVSSLHLPSSMPFSFRGFSIEDSVLARLFLGVFVLEDIFFKFTGRGLMRVLLQCWFKHDCAISQAVHEQYLSHKSHCISLLTIHISYMHLIRFHAYYVCTKGTSEKHADC